LYICFYLCCFVSALCCVLGLESAIENKLIKYIIIYSKREYDACTMKVETSERLTSSSDSTVTVATEINFHSEYIPLCVSSNIPPTEYKI